MTWLTTKKVSDLLHKDITSIQKAIKAGRFVHRYVSGIGRGGRRLEIALESLPQEAQDKYNHVEREPESIVHYKGKQREDADVKEWVVLQFKQSDLSADEFVERYNVEHPDAVITRSKLYRWKQKYESGGIAALIDDRGGYNKGQSTIPDDVKRIFLAYWMQEKGNKRSGGGPSIASCYRLTQLNFPGQQLPSITTFQRYVQSIPYPAKVLGREGKKAFADKCQPYIQFDYRSICTNEVWCADNHVFDLWVKNSAGRVFRPWVIGWMDKRSRYIVGYLLVDHDPNADAVLDAFARSVVACGIPERVLLDNGKDYTAHDLFNRNFALSLANEMSLKVTNATPYNAKAKLIERFFNTLEYSYCIHLPSYFGADPQRRPEKLQKVCEKLKDEAMPFNEFAEFLETVIGQYNNTVHSGDAMEGMTPCQAFEQCIVRPIRIADPVMLSMYFKRTSRLLTVGRNGVRVPELQQYYDAEELFPYQRKKVYVRYNTDDIRQVYCISEDGEFICMAESTTLGSLDQELTAQNMRRLNALKKQRRKQARDYIPDTAVPSVQQLAIESGMTFDKPDLKVIPTMQTVNSAHHRKAKKIIKAEQKQEVKRKQSANSTTQREEDEAYYKYMMGGHSDGRK